MACGMWGVIFDVMLDLLGFFLWVLNAGRISLGVMSWIVRCV